MNTPPERVQHNPPPAAQKCAPPTQKLPCEGVPATPAPFDAIPSSRAFRAHVLASMGALGVSARQLALTSGVTRQGLSAFLSNPMATVTLSTAHDISCGLREISKKKGIPLPPLSLEAS